VERQLQRYWRPRKGRQTQRHRLHLLNPGRELATMQGVAIRFPTSVIDAVERFVFVTSISFQAAPSSTLFATTAGEKMLYRKSKTRTADAESRY
jgi:hypothetical protein